MRALRARHTAVALAAACLVAPLAFAVPAAAVDASVQASDAESATLSAAAAEADAIITVDGTVPSGGHVGEVVRLPGGSARDVDGTVLPLVITAGDPTGVVTMITPTAGGGHAFTPQMPGSYVIGYAATDSTGGISEQTYTVTVSGTAIPASAPPVGTAAAVEPGGPDVRFAAIGDIHLQWGELSEAYDFWSEQNVQAALFVGDLTNSATEGEYAGLKETIDAKADLNVPAIAALGNHDVSGISSYDLFTQATGGQKPNADYTVNGYRVITVSPGAGTIDPDTGKPSQASAGNYAYAQDWLQQRLTDATAEDPTKPVMVLVHHPLQCTHYVSNEWYGTGLASGCGDDFESVFDDFPQAVVWGGHIHTPQNIPTSIWQGQEGRGGTKGDKGFTTVNAPPLAYYEFESGVINSSPTSRGNDTTPDDAGENRQTAIVEISGSMVTIKNYDLLADEWIDQTWSWDIADSVDVTKSYDERFPFNNTFRAGESDGPIWADGAGVTVEEISATKAMVSFPQATPAPNEVGDIVHKYRYTTIDVATGEEVNTFLQWSGFYNLPMPEDRRHEVWNLIPETEYEIRITPINAWGKEGAPLTARFTTVAGADGEGPFDASSLTFEDLLAPVPSADLLDVRFRDGQATDVSEAARVLTAGAEAEITMDEEIGREVALGVQRGATAIRTDMWTDADYANLEDGFTLDATFRLDSIDGGYIDIVGGMQSGGVGLEAVGTSDSTYELQFWYASPRPTVTLNYGEWYHVTAWYDGQNARLYVDGKKKIDVEHASFTVMPSYEAARYMVIGGDANTSGSLNDATMNGRIAGVEIYGAPLSDKDVYRVAMRERTILDTMPPLVRVDPEASTDAIVGSVYEVPAAQAVDNSGVVSTTLEITGPNGAPVEFEGAGASAERSAGVMTFTPADVGEYTLTYTATDAAARQAQASFSVTATAVTDGGTAPGGGGSAPDGGPDAGEGTGTGSAGSGADDALAATGATVPALTIALGIALLAAAGILLKARRRRESKP